MWILSLPSRYPHLLCNFPGWRWVFPISLSRPDCSHRPWFKRSREQGYEQYDSVTVLSATLRISSIIDSELVRLSAESLNLVLVRLKHGTAIGYSTLMQQFARFHRWGGRFFGNGFLPLSSWVSNRLLGCRRTFVDGRWRIPVLVQIGDSPVPETVSWIELTFVSALYRLMSTLRGHSLFDTPLCIVSSNSGKRPVKRSPLPFYSTKTILASARSTSKPMKAKCMSLDA